MLRDFTSEAFDIVIQAGQSNAEGYGFGEVEEAYSPNDKVFYLNRDFTVVPATEYVIGNEIQSNFSLSFAAEYLKNGRLKDGRSLLILRTAVGGTGFSDRRWGIEDDLYLHMMKMVDTALKLNNQNRLVALLWHQGETDAINKVSYKEHYENLMKLVSSVKSEFYAEDLPFIAGDFVQCFKNENIEICTPVVDAVRDVCRDCKSGAFAESDGLLSNYQELHRNTLGWGDNIHFSRRAIYELGRRYFDCFLQIVNAQAVSTD